MMSWKENRLGPKRFLQMTLNMLLRKKNQEYELEEEIIPPQPVAHISQETLSQLGKLLDVLTSKDAYENGKENGFYEQSVAITQFDVFVESLKDEEQKEFVNYRFKIPSRTWATNYLGIMEDLRGFGLCLSHELVADVSGLYESLKRATSLTS